MLHQHKGYNVFVTFMPTKCYMINLTLDMAKLAGRVGFGFGSGQSRCRSNVSQVKTGHFKRVKNEFGSIGLRIGSGWPVFFNLFFFFNKENNMFLLLGKLCNKLLDVKYIILNSPFISRMNSVKLINFYSKILKLYKFNIAI